MMGCNRRERFWLEFHISHHYLSSKINPAFHSNSTADGRAPARGVAESLDVIEGIPPRTFDAIGHQSPKASGFPRHQIAETRASIREAGSSSNWTVALATS